MQQRLKQRLIGAVVLVALAVIFLPMLLTGPVEQKRVDVPIEIPPEPAVASAPDVPPPSFAEQPVPAAEALARVPRPVIEPEPGPDVPPPAPERAPPVATQENVAAVGDGAGEEQQAAAAEAPSAEPPSAEPDPVTRAPATVEATTASGSWAVQVGAFRGRDNALGRRDSLRQAGFPAYVDEVSSAGEPLYRVRLGPVAERAEAEGMAGRVEDEQEIAAIVVPR